MCRVHVTAVLVFIVLLTVLSAPGTAETVAWWDFEQGPERVATDRAAGVEDEVLGFHKYVRGVSGDALRFDGYSTMVRREAKDAPKLGDSFSFEAWVAFQAYPWGQCAIVSQRAAEDAVYAKKRPAEDFPPGKDPSAGYYFAVDARGRVHLQVSVDGEWISCQSEARVPLLEWTHIAGTYDAAEGLTIYINGEKAGSTRTSGPVTFAPDVDLLVGRNHNKQRVEHSIISVIPANYSFDGYLDEVKIHDSALHPNEIAKAYEATKPSSGTGMAYRKLPTEPRSPAPFGAYYTKLKFDEAWDAIRRESDHPDVVVLFDDAAWRFVSWRGTGYVPFWVSENDIWYTNEFNESWPKGEKPHISEPMSDKQTRYSNVRIIENNDARVVLHWRYALTNTDYDIAYEDPLTGWGDWADEYDYIYPDGLALRKQRIWSSQLDQPHEFQESIVLSQPGTLPEDNIELDAVTIVNMKGETYTYSWADGLPGPPPGPDEGPPSAVEEGEEPDEEEDDFLKGFSARSFPNIQLVNIKSKAKPFLIVSDGPYTENWPFGQKIDGPVIVPYTGYGRPEVSVFGYWNHWPVAQVPSDARWALDPDRTAHSSVSSVLSGVYETTENYKVKLSLQGMTEKPAEELVPLAKSWLHAPALALKGLGYTSKGYDQAERAYQIVRENRNDPKPLQIEIAASEEHPVVNLAFVITGWGDTDASLTLNGEPVSRGKNFRFGHRSTPEGKDLIVWVKTTSTSPVEVVLTSQRR